MNSKIGPVLVGLSFLGLVVFIMIFCAKQSSDFAGFSQYWGLFATLVGVATGAIPSFFFGSQASEAKTEVAKARSETAAAHTRAEREAARTAVLAGLVDKAEFQDLVTSHPHLFA